MTRSRVCLFLSVRIETPPVSWLGRIASFLQRTFAGSRGIGAAFPFLARQLPHRAPEQWLASERIFA